MRTMTGGAPWGARTRIALTLFCLGLMGAGPTAASDSFASDSFAGDSLPEPVFAVGEVLTYAVKWGPVRAGTARMAVEGIVEVESRPCYHIVSEVRSNALFSLFYPVEDRVETWIDVERLVPLRHEKHLREGTYRQDEIMVFDHDAGQARYADGEWVAFEPGVQDILSALYYVRCLKFPQKGPIFVENQTNKKNYRLEVRAVREETVSTPVGDYVCTVIEPILKTTGLFKQEGRLWIWLAHDAGRLPVRMRSKIKVGAITAILEEISLGTPLGRGWSARGGGAR